MIHRKNSPVRFVLNRRYYFAKTIHANFGQHYVHAKAECIEFLLTVLDILLFDLNLVAYCTYNIQTAGYTPVHILRPCYQLKFTQEPSIILLELLHAKTKRYLTLNSTFKVITI